MWRLVLGDDLRHRQVLNDEERGRYLSDGLGLSIIQTTPHVKPYNSGEYVTEYADRTLFSAVEQREDTQPSLISSNQAIDKYGEVGALQHIDKTEHYQNLKGMNDFKHIRLGIVAGSVENGEDEIKRWAALADQSVESNGEKGTARSYGPFGDKFLHGMRENEVLQAIMRFGREEKDGEKGATVYVHTAAIPDWVPVDHQHADVELWNNGKTDGMEQVLSAIQDQNDQRISEIVDHPSVSISKRQTRRNLKTLQEYGFVEGTKDGTGWLWSDIQAETASPYGYVEFAD